MLGRVRTPAQRWRGDLVRWRQVLGVHHVCGDLVKWRQVLGVCGTCGATWSSGTRSVRVCHGPGHSVRPFHADLVATWGKQFPAPM